MEDDIIIFVNGRQPKDDGFEKIEMDLILLMKEY